MKAMILGAGRGKRMRELTANMPKPLLKVGGRPIIEWQIEALRAAGIGEIVINTAHCPQRFDEILGDGASLGVHITYSNEGDSYEKALETRGGIAKALPLLRAGAEEDEAFIVVAGDIITNYDYRRLIDRASQIRSGRFLAHLVLVSNPPYHQQGDMTVVDGKIVRQPPRLTYSSMGVFSPRLFESVGIEPAPLFPWLYQYADQGLVSGEYFDGEWVNLGTPEDLAAFNENANLFG